MQVETRAYYCSLTYIVVSFWTGLLSILQKRVYNATLCAQ